MEKNRTLMVWRTLLVLFMAFLWGELDAYAANKAWVKYANGTLTFRYSEKESLDTDEYWLDKLNEYNMLPGWYEKRGIVTKVVFDKSFANARPSTCRGWFRDFESLTAIEGIGYLNTENVCDMHGMFDNCRSLTSLDVSKFNTLNVKDMAYMFYGCRSLTSLDLSRLITFYVRDMSAMFTYCESITILDLSNFNTGNVMWMNSMFAGCVRLTTIYVSRNFVRHTTQGYDMFQGCEMLAGDIAYDENRDKTNDMDYATPEGGYFSHNEYTHPWVKYADGTLTFRYGYKKELGTDEYWLNTDGNEPGWSGKSQDVTKVVFEPTFVAARPTTCYRWFQGFGNLSTIEGIERLNTSEVTKMNNMFYGCSSLTFWDVLGFNTSKVTDMSDMFYGCSGLTSLNLFMFDTSKVTDMSGMFYGCSALTFLDLSKFNTSNATNMSCMFYGCSSLATVNVSTQFVTSGVSGSNGYGMFSGCTKLVGGIAYDASKTDKTYATTVGGYFLDLHNFLPWVKYTDGTLTFQFSEKKTLGTDEYWLNEKSTVPDWYEKKGEVIKVVFDKSFAMARPTTCRSWFQDFKYLSTIEGMENLNTWNVSDMRYMFCNCSILTSLDVTAFITSKVTTMKAMFYRCSSLTSLDLSKFNTSNVTDMSHMFNACSNLKTICVSDQFVTSKVTEGVDMFYGCKSLEGEFAYDDDKIDQTYATPDGGYFTDKQYSRPWVKYADGVLIFQYGYKKTMGTDEYLLNEGSNSPGWYERCSSVKTVVFDKTFGKALPTTCYRWFYGCGNLSAIEGLENFHTSNVTDMESMFESCFTIKSLDLSNFNTSKVTNMQSMFKGCKGLTSLDVSSFNTQNVADMRYMFQDCSNLAAIYANDKFVTSRVTESADMFQDCTSLVGGISYDANKTNVAYAKIDGGYFTSSARPWVKYANGTLTFQFGNKLTLGTDEYWLNEEEKTPGWNNKKDNVTKVVFDPSFAKSRPTTCYRWFANFGKLRTIEGIENLNTSNATNMYQMFKSCEDLTSLDVSGFNTQRVTNMASMFSGCRGLKSLDVSGFDTRRVTSMRRMFAESTDLESLDVSKFNTSNVTDMNRMFFVCVALKSLDVSKFDTHNVKDMGSMFNGCSGLDSLDVSNFDTWNVTDMGFMFSGCSGLISLNLSSFDTRNVTDMKWMFNKCSGLAAIFVSEQFVTSSVTTDADMFTGCTSLVGDVAYDDSKTDKTYARLDGGYFTAGRPWVKYADGTLTFQYGLKATLDADEYWLNVGSDDPGWYDKRQSVKSVVFDNTFSEALPTTCYRWFYGCENLSAIEGLENFNTSNVTNMSYMFNGCSSFTSLDVSNFDTRQLTDMGYMFFGCTGLDSLDVSNFDTRQVTDMGYVFCGCTGLTSLDVTNFDTQQVTDMGGMFNGCSGLTSLDVSRFNTSNMMYMGGMFNGCSGLTSLDVSKFNTSNVTDMGSMFGGCSGLTSLDLTNFNTSNVIDMSQMFRGCSGLTAIYASEAFQLSERLSSEEMFAGCEKLQGDIAFDANHTDKTYAKLQDGYFADKAYIRPWAKCADGTFTFYYGYKRVLGDGAFVLNDAGALPDWNGDGLDKSRIRKVVFDASFDVVRPTSCASWFAGFTELQSLEGLYNLNTSEVTNMNSMFLNCESLRSLDLTFFDTEQVTDMGRMFEGCIRMETLDLMSFDTHKIYNISQMFYGDKKLKTIYASETFSLSHLEDSKYVNFQDIFTDCVSLAGEVRYNPNWDKGRSFATMIQGYFLDKQYIRPWVEFADGTLTFNYGYKRLLEFQENYVPNTSGQQAIPGWIRDHSKEIKKVAFDKAFAEALPTYCYGWFSGCENLTEMVGLMYLNTSEVYDMGSMFEGCTSLTSLDLSQFDTRNVSEMSRMFSGCSSLAVIYAGDKFKLSTLTSGTDMFAGCENLKGDIAYDASIVDKTYAKNKDGYFLNGASIRPWAKYDSGVLTFYYGKKLELGEDEYEIDHPRWGIDHKADITKVVFDKSFGEARPTTCANWFGYCDKLATIEGLEYLNTSEVESMKAMFYRCSSLTALDLSHFDTQGVTDMSWMFMSCNSLATVNLSSFNTSKVTDMNAMFAECKSLTSLDLSNFDTQYVTDMSNMFSTCEALTTLNVSKFDTKNVSDMRYMFELCDSLTSLDVSSFDMQNVSDMRYMFSSKNLQTIYASESFVVKEGAGDKNMFYDCLNLYGDIAYDANYTDKTYAKFEGGYFTHKEYTRPWAKYADGTLTLRYGYKKELDENQDEYPVETDDMYPKWVSYYYGNSDITKAVLDKSFAHYLPVKTDYWFSKCTALEMVEGLENLNTSRLTSMSNMFAECSSLKSLDLSALNTENVEKLDGMFQDCSALETVNLANFSTRKVSNFYGLFSGCSSLKSLDLKNFDTSNAEWMGMMFRNCSQLTDLDVSSFDTQKVTDMSSMFSGCSGLRALDLKNFDTKAVTSMGYMFWKCANLTDLDVSGFDTQQVGDMGGMFSDCSSLKTLDVSKFVTNQVYSMNEMFSGCPSLESLDLSKFNVDGVSRISRMFKGCASLTTLTLPNFKNVSYLDEAGEMFSGCSSLEALDLSTLTAYVYDTNQMFANTKQLKVIYFADGFDVDNLGNAYTEAMFEGCPATLYCSPLQYEKFKRNSVIAYFGNAVKPYVGINSTAKYGTLCVPVGSSLAEGSFTGFDKLYQVKDADKDKGTVTMVEAKSIEPGVPYVYHRDLPENAKMSVITFDVDENASAVTAPKNEGNLLKGTFESIVADGGSYILQTDGNFHPVAADNKTLMVGAYRAYLDLDGGDLALSKSYRMVFGDGGTTGVDRINGEGADGYDNGVSDQVGRQPKVYFDLMGRKVKAPRKGGVYIENGRKVVYGNRH